MVCWFGFFFPSKISTYHFFPYPKIKKKNIYIKGWWPTPYIRILKAIIRRFWDPEMFVFFLGTNDEQPRKRANQPSQPARLVTETTQGLPTPRLKPLWSSPGGARFHRRDTGPRTPMTLPNLLVESIFNYISHIYIYIYIETAEWINLWNTRSFKPWCSNILWRKQNLLLDILSIFE